MCLLGIPAKMTGSEAGGKDERRGALLDFLTAQIRP
jgi:hypothetical protein